MNTSEPAAKPTLNADDYAILIGVSNYVELERLKGPVEDVRAMLGWLTDPAGGGVPPQNITVVISEEAAAWGNEHPRPTLEHVQNGIYKLVERASKANRIGRRLYLYVSGHGYLSVYKEVSLLLADAMPGRYDRAIDVTAYADFFRESGAFDEVVLFADCDQIEEPNARPAPVPWHILVPERRKPASTFYAFGTQPGGVALEGAVTPLTGGSPVLGIFTRALLEGLTSTAAPPDGTVTSETLRVFLEHRTDTHSEGRQRPYFTSTYDSPLVFVSRVRTTKQKDADAPEKEQVKPRGRERVSTQADDPATVDELGRRPFAEVIAARIEEVWKSNRARAGRGEAGAFMVHIHGPWGSGKSSVLNFLSAHLQDEKRPPAQRWVVVEYNAWRNQRVRPPWWTLIREIYTQSARQLGLARSLLLRVQWLVWRVRADLLPALLALGLVVLAVLFATGVISLAPEPTPAAGDAAAGGATQTGAAASAAGGSAKVAAAVELGIKILSTALAAGVALFALSRSLVFGSARAAQTYTELRSDPLGPIVNLFRKLVRAIRRPVLVLVDDLDRCDSNHVVELLEGIQTLFRTAPVTYVVAADRKWICSSFEKGFADFGRTIGEPGRPLGYLFLDKVFQVSASIPRMAPEVRQRYWSGLLRAAESADPGAMDDRRKTAELEARVMVKQARTQEELEDRIADVQDDPMREQAMRAAAALQITSTEAQREAEHLLQNFAGLLEPNPRSMKRLVNAFGLNQATQFLEGRNVAPELLARWTIIELRWPLLADFLAARPQLVKFLADGETPDDRGIAGDIKKLFGDALVREVVAGDGVGEASPLDEEAVRRIVGASPLAKSNAAAPPVHDGAADNREE